jgi:MFS family permease
VNTRTIRRRFLLLRALRFLPTGLLIPVTILLLTERGFSLGQIGLVMAAQGVLVLLLELPTGGLADALGRRPVLLAATVIELSSGILLIFAYSLPLLAIVWALQGVYRALESGPLDAWYVDAALAADPDADIEGGLSAGGAAIGAAIPGRQSMRSRFRWWSRPSCAALRSGR